MRQPLLRGLMAATALVLASGVARADETTFCNAYITSLPYTITTQGHYCFNRNLSTAQTTGAAITINTDFVVLDLNNFKLGGGSAGLATAAIGVLATDHSNITVRNGNIRGFAIAIKLYGTTAAQSVNHLVENNVLDGNTSTGVWIHGSNSVIRNNQILNTGGSTAGGAHPWLNCSVAINAAYSDTGSPGGSNIDTIGNLIVGLAPAASGTCFGGANSFGIVSTSGSVAQENSLRGFTTAAFSRIFAAICKGNIVQATNPYSCTLVGTTNHP
jgi:hypothetical protein